MERFLRVHKISLLLVFIAALFYASFAYELVRTDFEKLISLYAALFFLSWKLIQLEQKNFWFLAGVALLLRLVFFGAIPNLSQDFYRFIWDGRMLLSGWNPYIYLPESLLAQSNVPISQGNLLDEGMGELSAGNYTNYPPLNQLVFALAGLLAGKSILGSVIVMRIVIIAADIGVLYFGKKLLEKFELPGHQIFWYVLNPLVIIELTGNLHFEGVMAFFLVWSLYLLHSRKWILSAIAFAASVLLKLIPLLFLPLLFRYFVRNRNDQEKLGLTRLIGYYFIVGIVVIIGFIPFMSSEFISSFSGSIGLWFQKFEFNASIYYVVRWIGFQVKGYNIIETAGKVLPLVTILVLAGLAFFRKNSSLQQLISTMLLGITAYFFLSTTIHPWYLMIPLLLSVFTRFRYMFVWSFLIFLSYYAYSTPQFKENFWLIALEYILVFGLFGYELFNFRKEKILRTINYSEE
ncbi:mannosyltransferase [Gillisia sp. Q332]|uniref:mannosyltransferase n=1 Tax=Gillisia xinjiangensis TaxID=3384765 RepID=UPI00391CBA63